MSSEEDVVKPAESVRAKNRHERQEGRASGISSLDQLRGVISHADRVRISLRLETTVDEQLDQLASLRGLDRNTAISLAITQDWIACFGPAKRTP